MFYKRPHILSNIKDLFWKISIYHSSEKPKHSLILIIGLTLVYGILVSLGAWHHEAWRDEAQAWLISRDLGYIDIFWQMRYEGTPPLWHLLISIPAKLNLHYFSLHIINLIIIISAIGIFLTYAPFTQIIKFLLIFSYYFVYEYSVIARNYSLTVFFLFVIASLYPLRQKKPILFLFLVFLLMLSNIHSFGIGVGIGCVFFIERFKLKKLIILSSLIALVMLSAGFLLFSHYEQQLKAILFSHFNLNAPISAIKNMIIPFDYSSAFLTAISFLVLVYVLLMLFIRYIAKNKMLIFISLLAFGWIMYIFIFKHAGYHRHHGLLLVFFVFILWISNSYPTNLLNLSGFKVKFFKSFHFSTLVKIAILNLIIMLILSLIYSQTIYYKEIRNDFSGSKKMANYIISHNLESHVIVSNKHYLCLPVIPYFKNKKTFWLPQYEDYYSFCTWTSDYYLKEDISLNKILQKVENHYPDKSKVLLLTTYPIIMTDSFGLNLLYHSNYDSFWADGYSVKENYWLYKLN